GDGADDGIAHRRTAAARSRSRAVERDSAGNRTAHEDACSQVRSLVTNGESYRELAARAHYTGRRESWRGAAHTDIRRRDQFGDERVAGTIQRGLQRVLGLEILGRSSIASKIGV